MELNGVELGPKMAACTEKERRFVLAWVAGLADSGAHAARLAGYSDASHASLVRAFELQRRPRVIEAVEEVAKEKFRGLIPATIKAVERLILDPKHPDHAKAALSLLSRLGFAEKSDIQVNGTVQVNHQDAAVDDLRRAKAMGFSREALEAMFGHSGLSRYEAMLANGHAPKVIEHVDPVGAVVAHKRDINHPETASETESANTGD